MPGHPCQHCARGHCDSQCEQNQCKHLPSPRGFQSSPRRQRAQTAGYQGSLYQAVGPDPLDLQRLWRINEQAVAPACEVGGHEPAGQVDRLQRGPGRVECIKADCPVVRQQDPAGLCGQGKVHHPLLLPGNGLGVQEQYLIELLTECRRVRSIYAEPGVLATVDYQ